MNSAPEQCWAVVPAAGSGSRMGAHLPKQYLTLADATVLEHSLGALLACDAIAGVVVALHAEDDRPALMPLFDDARVATVTGAAERSGSVLNGLRALLAKAAPEHWVLVHDAARPCVSGQDINTLIEVVTASGVGGILAEPVTDTVKLADERGRVAQTLDRNHLWRAQTPQMFRLGELEQALAAALARGLAITDEASAMEAAGLPVQLVPGSARNLKVTSPDDLPLAEFYLRQQDTHP